ncbi:MAG TPA: radical SAM protein [Calditrichia bacterium]|nr:B12-binding domain-containing radical SAM protein [Calditrichota bacterium]HQU72177.1 radical SAM protein [Calditrichia bacterium]HQV32512.1 radical SAM protein [Calditrichia bacterium]
MKIALLAPAGAMHRYNGSFSVALHYAPLTLTTLAALVPEELEAEIELYDETAQFIPADLEADLIGITAITGTSQRAYRWADWFRSRGITVVLGGVHPTLMPEEAAQHADAVVVGYAEETWPQLLRDFQAGTLQPYYRMKPDFAMGGRPRPKRHLLKKSRYITLNSVEATRGCLHDCSFCVVPSAWGRSVLTRPVREVVEEVEALPGKDVIFIDVNLIANPPYAKQLFRELAPLNKWWFGLVTSNIVRNQELFDLMVKSGCKGVLIGFESLTAPSLQSINKSFNKVEEYHALVGKLHDAGIGINGTFVFGTDGDDPSVFEQNVGMIQKLKIDLPRYSLMTPFPGTGLYRSLQQQGRITEKDWALFDVEHCVIQPAGMSPEALEAGLEWAWKETYTFGSILERIPSMSMRFALNALTNLGYRKYARKLPRFTREVMLDNSDVPLPEKNLKTRRGVA